MKRLNLFIIRVLLPAAFLAASHVLAQGTIASKWIYGVEKIHTDPENTRVGIGMTAPTAPLEIGATGLMLFLNQSGYSGPSFPSVYLKILAEERRTPWTPGAGYGSVCGFPAEHYRQANGGCLPRCQR